MKCEIADRYKAGSGSDRILEIDVDHPRILFRLISRIRFRF